MSALFQNKTPTATSAAGASAADPNAKPKPMMMFDVSKMQENLKKNL